MEGGQGSGTTFLIRMPIAPPPKSETREKIITLNQPLEQRLAQADARIHRFHELSLEINALAEKARSEHISDLEAIMTLIGDISLYRA